MRTAIFITARMKSTRLPRKLLLELRGKPIIEHLIDRIKLAKLPDLIVLCTSTNPDDTVLVDIAKKNNISYFRGSEDDVLERFLEAALNFKVDFIVVTWGDEPLCDSNYIDKTIELFKKANADFISCDELPTGTFVYGVKVKALKKVCDIKNGTDTEVWGDYFTKTGLFRAEHLKVEDMDLKHPEIRMTIDYPQDYEFMKVIFEKLYHPDKIFTLKEVILFLKNNTEIMNINKDLQELYKKRIEKHTKIKLKNQKEGK